MSTIYGDWRSYPSITPSWEDAYRSHSRLLRRTPPDKPPLRKIRLMRGAETDLLGELKREIATIRIYTTYVRN